MMLLFQSVLWQTIEYGHVLSFYAGEFQQYIFYKLSLFTGANYNELWNE